MCKLEHSTHKITFAKKWYQLKYGYAKYCLDSFSNNKLKVHNQTGTMMSLNLRPGKVNKPRTMERCSLDVSSRSMYETSAKNVKNEKVNIK